MAPPRNRSVGGAAGSSTGWTRVRILLSGRLGVAQLAERPARVRLDAGSNPASEDLFSYRLTGVRRAPRRQLLAALARAAGRAGARIAMVRSSRDRSRRHPRNDWRTAAGVEAAAVARGTSRVRSCRVRSRRRRRKADRAGAALAGGAACRPRRRWFGWPAMAPNRARPRPRPATAGWRRAPRPPEPVGLQ